jgi:hypothetical protein
MRFNIEKNGRVWFWGMRPSKLQIIEYRKKGGRLRPIAQNSPSRPKKKTP